MAARPRIEVRTMVRALKLQLTGDQTLVAALEGLHTSKWTVVSENGTTLIGTSEAGGSVQFTVEGGWTSAQLATMAEEALEWVNTLPDPENPPLDVPRYTRIHPTFHRAVL